MDKRLKELSRSLKTIEDVLNYAYEGYVLVDRDGRVVMINYDKLLGIKEAEAIGKPIDQVIENTRMHIVVKTGVEELRDVQRIQGHDMITNRIPIVIDGEVIGALGTVLFKDINEVKELAHHLLDLQSKINIYKGEIQRIEQVKHSFDNILTNNNKMKYLKSIAKRAAETNSTVLITGESGTGKELFAEAIHKAGYRKDGPFLAINCAAIPKGLIESELFGYQAGVFKGANQQGKIGKLEMASGGTIFLDEIGNMSLDMQVKLLRVLEAKEFEPVGSNRKISLDARLIAASNEDLEIKVQEGLFREDLYYRLNVISIDVPPLRDRLEDVVLLAEDMLVKLCQELNLEEKFLTEETKSILSSYKWPGNVRELRNVLERALNLTSKKHITPADLPERILDKTKNNFRLSRPMGVGSKSLEEIVDDAEKNAILEALHLSAGNRTEAAKLLGIHRTSLYRRMDKYDI